MTSNTEFVFRGVLQRLGALGIAKGTEGTCNIKHLSLCLERKGCWCKQCQGFPWMQCQFQSMHQQKGISSKEPRLRKNTRRQPSS